MKRWFLLPLLAGVALADGDQDARGWSPGTPAANMTQVVTPRAQKVEIPQFVVDQLTGPTLVYYFNPECGHCQATIPGVIALAAELEGDLAFLGIANSGASPAQLKWFRDTFEVPFPLMIDQPRGFSWSVGAQSTPTVLVLEPRDDGVYATDAYYPWFEGAQTIVKIRRDPATMWDHFPEDTYLGNSTCSACHLQETRSWQLTHHSVAYRTLYLMDEAENPECVGCHVTGLGEPTGFVSGDHGHAMTDVGCEACHSAGGPHDGKRVDAATTCAGCHDDKHSIAFSVEKGLPHIDHYLASTLTGKELDARYRELANGEAAKPLLAFPEAENVGVDACKSCHPKQVADWKASPHGHAMDRLSVKESKKLECVSCHATPTRTGAPPTELDGYARKDSVGCESCHGSGQAHVADPRAGTIEGLGEDCPVCVLEAVCTTCHDSENDPTWKLETRLQSMEGHGAP